jgi:CRP-like cAMP-binding protein
MGQRALLKDDPDKGCPVLHPEGWPRQVWDWVQVAALLYVGILVPVRVGFGIELEPLTAGWWLELVVDIYFIADVFVNFRTGYVDDGVTILRPWMIARHYLTTWLAVDIVSCLPIGYVTQIIEVTSDEGADDHTSSSQVNKSFKILRLLRLAKLLRLGRLKKIIKRHEEEMDNLMGYIKLGGALLSIGYTCHLIACAWYFFGEDAVMETEDGQLVPIQGWINRVAPHLGANTSLANYSTGHKYLVAYYWAITTLSTVGYGDITAQTPTERIFSLLAEMFGCLAFATLVGTLGSIMVGQKLLEEKVDKQLSELREFMQAKGIPKLLRHKVRRYMETLYEQKTGFDEREVLSQLPPAMAQDLLICLYQKDITNTSIFKNFVEGAITQLCLLIKPYMAMSGDVIYRRGDVGREIYIVIGGAVQISFGEAAPELVQVDAIPGIALGGELIDVGGTFGEGCVCDLLMTDQQARNYREPYKRLDTAQATKDCDLKFWSQDDLQLVSTNFPSVLQHLQDLEAGFKRKAQRATQQPRADGRPRQNTFEREEQRVGNLQRVLHHGQSDSDLLRDRLVPSGAARPERGAPMVWAGGGGGGDGGTEQPPALVERVVRLEAAVAAAAAAQAETRAELGAKLDTLLAAVQKQV